MSLEGEAINIFKDVIPSLNSKTSNLFDSGVMQDKDYNAYIINLSYSFGIDTILYANMMNCNAHLSPKMQYDFYWYGLDKGSRYNKWIKKENISDLENIKKYFNCSTKKAKQHLKVLKQEDIELINKFFKDII